MGNKPKELSPAAKEGRCHMAAKNTTPSRHAQLTALLEFAQEMGYTGHTDKLAAVADQWKPKGATRIRARAPPSSPLDPRARLSLRRSARS